ncbi:ATP-binding protein [Mariniflexile sp. AS56]|uniref:ATP-binding protein n=1 Tax=Mariniflexile sp. AS56 TaxID=3063957 RepID=UPI0026EF67B5|nr:ATP-binding protein [Mariniflexile sp. AS56]MDO7174053.1 ATP-binding protein [Mariniflexile sp. AS56]
MKLLFEYFFNRLDARLSLELKKESKVVDFPKIKPQNSFLERFIIDETLNENEVLLLLLVLVPHIKPNFLSTIISDYFPAGGEFPEFGGVKGKNHRGILPTGETAVYILAGNDLKKRFEAIKWIQLENKLIKSNVIDIVGAERGEPLLSGQLVLDAEYLHLFITETVLKPKMSSNFPAQLIETGLVWEDLILNKKTLDQIKEIEIWLNYNDILLQDWKMKSKIKPGFRVMFYGPSGTGKTLTANLLGKYTNRDVYRVDLSLVVSKFIGETEKNLSKLFNKAENKDWILFFDEADALFGKRTNVRDAHDKYANQEVSYLLQRIESHPGLVILASNFKGNIDTAFSRRFQCMIEFELPSATERLELWKNNLPKTVSIEASVSLEELAKKYEITGANIVNIVQHACLKTIAGKHKCIQKDHILDGIKKEYQKEGKSL